MFGTNNFGWQSSGSGGGGGSIGGAITSPEVAYGTSSNTIGGDATFSFSSTTKILTVNRITLNDVALGAVVNNTLALSGGILYFGTSGVWQEVSLT